jgi:uncharacterized protein HemY
MYKLAEVVLFCLILFFGITGIIYTSADFRYWGEVEKQCKSQGYIQNQTVRINCQVEENNK